VLGGSAVVDDDGVVVGVAVVAAAVVVVAVVVVAVAAAADFSAGAALVTFEIVPTRGPDVATQPQIVTARAIAAEPRVIRFQRTFVHRPGPPGS
jgi:hypothetical protein